MRVEPPPDKTTKRCGPRTCEAVIKYDTEREREDILWIQSRQAYRKGGSALREHFVFLPPAISLAPTVRQVGTDGRHGNLSKMTVTRIQAAPYPERHCITDFIVIPLGTGIRGPAFARQMHRSCGAPQSVQTAKTGEKHWRLPTLIQRKDGSNEKGTAVVDRP